MASAEVDVEYGAKSFWDARYEGSCSTLFDWYQDFDTLAQLLLPLLRPSSRVLHLGCGNSPLAESLYDAGFRNVTSLDYSAPCVEHMRHRNALLRPELSFECADARALALPPAAYDVIIDKGLLDAMLCAGDAAAGVGAMVEAVAAGLAPGGCFVLISFGAPPDRLHWVQHGARGWECDVWTLPKPGARFMAGATASEAGEEDADATPCATRYVQGAERAGSAHFVYIFTRPAAGTVAATAPAAPADAAPSGAADGAGDADAAPPSPAEAAARRWAF